MAVAFEYKVRDRSGNVVSGELEAENTALVASRLREMGFTPISIQAKKAGLLSRDLDIPFLGGVRLKEISAASRQFATLINAGITMVRSLGILAEQVQSTHLSAVYTQVRIDVEQGSSLSDALVKHPKIFSNFYVTMVRAGEAGGTLDEVLLRLASHIERQLELRRKVRSAMSYPTVVVGVTFLIMTIMLVFIVPTFKKLYASLGGVLPVPTQILLKISQVVSHWFFIVFPALVVCAYLFRRWQKSTRGREVWDRWVLKAPIFGKLVHKIALARFSRTFASMVQSGVPILETLDIVADTCGNTLVAQAVIATKAGVKVGDSIGRAMSEYPVIPPMVVHMMAVGEQTGELDTMLEKIAEMYESEVEATVNSLTSILEPLLIVIIGSCIGAMVISLYLPLFNIIKLIK